MEHDPGALVDDDALWGCIRTYCQDGGIDWEALTHGQQFMVLKEVVPCSIRCSRVGGPVDVKLGEACPECGKPHKEVERPPTHYQRLRNPIL